MCLYINEEVTKKFKRKKCKKITVYKVVEISYTGKHLFTPSQFTKINGGWFKASKTPHLSHLSSVSIVEEGVIHCYRTKNDAVDAVNRRYGRVVLKCTALLKDFVAAGLYDICFTKIWIPKKEITSVIRQLK